MFSPPSLPIFSLSVNGFSCILQWSLPLVLLFCSCVWMVSANDFISALLCSLSMNGLSYTLQVLYLALAYDWCQLHFPMKALKCKTLGMQSKLAYLEVTLKPSHHTELQAMLMLNQWIRTYTHTQGKSSPYVQFDHEHSALTIASVQSAARSQCHLQTRCTILLLLTTCWFSARCASYRKHLEHV